MESGEKPQAEFNEQGLENIQIPASPFDAQECRAQQARKAKLISWGWNAEVATMVGILLDYPLADAAYLNDKGCPPELAMRILSPFYDAPSIIPPDWPIKYNF